MLHPIGPRYTFFFQIDIHGRCRTGKVMKYDPISGHRIKDEAFGGRITWVHSLMKRSGVLKADWELTQCLFGEHLLTKYPGRTVALVESEKTAVICSALMPEYVWLATGGKSQLGDKLNVLQQRTIIAFPDVDGYELWKQKASELTSLRITVSDYLETTATPEERDAHIDIADRLIAQIRDGSFVPPADCPIRWDKGQRDTKQRKSYEYADIADRQDVPQLSSASAELECHGVCFPFRRLCRVQGQYAELHRHGHHFLSGPC